MLRNSLRHALARAAAPRSFTALTAATRPLAAGAPLRLGAARPLSASSGASSSSDAPTTDAPTEEVIWQLRNLVQMMPAPLVAAYSRDNMSQPQLNQLGVQAMITKWQRFPGDTGSSEVQIAVATERIAHKVKHLQSHKKDHNSNRHLMMLVHQRNRMLLYLRRKDRAKYHEVIAGLGLRPSQSFDPTLKVRHSTWKKGKPPKKAKKKSNKRKALKPWLRS